MKNTLQKSFDFIINHKEFLLGYVVASTLYFTAQIISSLAIL